MYQNNIMMKQSHVRQPPTLASTCNALRLNLTVMHWMQCSADMWLRRHPRVCITKTIVELQLTNGLRGCDW
jgi:hypothetical protein